MEGQQVSARSHGLSQQHQAGAGAGDRAADPRTCGVARQGFDRLSGKEEPQSVLPRDGLGAPSRITSLHHHTTARRTTLEIAHHMVGAAKEPGAAAGHLRRASGFKAG